MGEGRAIAGLGGSELFRRLREELSTQEWGSHCKQSQGGVSGTEGTQGERRVTGGTKRSIVVGRDAVERGPFF